MTVSDAAFKAACGCMLFAQLPVQQAEEILRGEASQKQFSRGEIIYSPENYQRALGIIARGTAIVEKENGVLLNRLEAGSCFGAAALFAQEERYVTTIRAKSECTVLFLPAASMERILMNYPQIALNYIRFLSGRIQFLNRRIDSFVAPNVEETLLSYLRQQPQGKLDRVPMAKLAEILNVGRTSLYRAVQHLEQCNMITREGKTICLTSSEDRQDNFPGKEEIV